MDAKPRLEVDGARFGTLEEFWNEVSARLVPGRSWGRNQDAFNDILRGGFGTPEGGFVLVWKNHALSRERLGFAETVQELQRVLAGCHPTNRPDVEARLNEAQHRSGPTVFDWLVAIVLDHGPGGAQAEDGVDLVLL